jgi:SAM-dependent methyltransferase
VRTQVTAECPLCHCQDAHLLYSVTSAQAVSHALGPERTPDSDSLRAHVEQLWNADSCDFVRCDHCELGFAHPFTAGDAAFYEQVYSDDSEYTAWRWEFQRTRDVLRSLLAGDDDHRAHRLLEIGAGDGAFIRGVTPGLLPKDRVECTEHSAYGRAQIEAFGVRCRSLEPDQIGVTDAGAFDVVCMFQVLEHLGDLDGLFAALSRITADRAHLFVGVPNDRGRDAFDALGCAEDVPPTHISRWSPRCFSVAAQSHGWTVAETATEPVGRSAQLAKYAWFRYEQSGVARRLNALPPGTRRRVLKSVVAGALLCASPWPSVLRLLSTDRGTVRWVHMQRAGSGMPSPDPAAPTTARESGDGR